MAKPFSIQSPEDIAKQYAGNKQKIAEAMQTGIIDPTAGVLAGMFIDRMRNAQTMEGVNPPSVAQQVMGGAPAAPSSPPASGGLGGTPQAAPPMTPMQPPMPAPEAPMGMAAGGSTYEPPYMKGGLDGLPIPDTMFDEPGNGGFNDGYAGGGIVAFSGGGMSGLYEAVEQLESGGRQGAVSPKGARGVMQLMPGTMRDPGFGITPMRDDSEEENRRVGRQYLDAMLSRYGDQTTALMAYNWGPGNVDKWIAAGRPASMVPKETKNYVANLAGGTGAGAGAGASSAGLPPPPDLSAFNVDPNATVEEGMGLYEQYMPKRDNTALKMMAEEARKTLDPAEQKKAREQDMWATLTEIGFGMAASNSPYFLQAVGAAAAAALPGAKEDKKARAAVKKDAIRTLADVEGVEYNQAAEKTKYGLDYLKDKYGLKDREAARAIEVWGKRYSEGAQTERTRMGEEGATTRARVATADDASAQEKSDIIQKRQATLQASRSADEALADNPEYSAAKRAGNTARMDVLRQQHINKYLGEVLGDPGDENRARLVDAWYTDIKGMIARGEKIYTPQGKEIVVYRGGKPQPLNTLSDAGIRRIAEQYAGVASSASSGGSSAMAEADRILAGQSGQ